MPLFTGERHVLTLFAAIISISGAVASYGDISHPYRKCLNVCTSERCHQRTTNIRFYDAQPLYLRALGWDCESECKYECMWEAVDYFVKNDAPVPQFHGKWPFTRFLGMQEPASAVASVLNGLSQLYSLRRLKRVIPPTAPFFHLWHLYGYTVANAWIWSFVFHVRDTEWTEKLDYFFAFSLILVQLYASLVRMVGASPVRKPLALGIVFGLVFLHHCVSMSLVKFDYGYNMKVNIFFSAIYVVTWSIYCVRKIYKGYTHFWWALTFTFWFTVSALLETLDFPPLFWILDSHALWHFSTVPLPIVFSYFVVQDSWALLRGEERTAKTAYHFELNVDDSSVNIEFDNRAKGE